MSLHIRPADSNDIQVVSAILGEAAEWLQQQGTPMWKADELLPDNIEQDVLDGLFYLAEKDGVCVGTVKFQLEDPLFWPDLQEGEAAYVHRLAVSRAAAGGGISKQLLQWAADRTRELGRRYLRLDCEADRTRLREVYERFGFKHHSDRQVGPYFVSRYELALA
ncbi:GNAT family N-acetyltransferase [Brevifollis gellanilyticus]|uniref:GNAT family N-acetyltransferase n=1 Tax=Brevifollis gellanilyticus TaxID=748831 RepID=A0A512MDM7_9BACT|nr:GNAT family N-acetyltransferase [Brevifollis gellanilyticus]GEP44802.1 GNAT family N-acetyltransferase [Brevifollis gellanilyticus]